MVYVIETKVKGWVVERRYNEFYELRTELVRLFPGYIVPPLPKKKSGKKTDPDFLATRKFQLQFFVNQCLRHPVLRSTTMLQSFLSLPAKDWETKQKYLSKIPEPKDPTEIRTLEGIAKIGLNEYVQKYSADLSGSIEDLKKFYQAYIFPLIFID